MGSAALWPLLAAQAEEAPAPQTIEIIGTSPLPGQGTARDQLPYSTQQISRDALDRAQANNVSDYLARRLPGVQVNDIQGSPFQGDLTYRGYRASGMLGASQGLSVYLDGVRINEPFGDVVNWDLVPEFALQSVSLVPGANPAFGLNTLGGALSFTTASGLTAPGGRAELSLGSFGRRQLSASYGHADADGWNVYVGGNAFREDGWRDHSDGHLNQALLKLGRSQGDTTWSTSLLLGRSTLVGNGLTPAYTLEDDDEVSRTPDLYAQRRAAVYTYPDETKHQLTQWQFNLAHSLDAQHTLSGLAYWRKTKRDTVNGDTADDLDDDDIAEGINAALNQTATRQQAAGFATSFSGQDGAHQWQTGLTFDSAKVRFRQSEQAGFFTDDRGVEADDEEPELSAHVSGRSWNLGLFASDTWRVAEGTHLTGTLRWNRARVSNTLTTADDDTGELEEKPKESFHYRSLNPALGLTQQLAPGLSFFANLARNTRVPTVIELGCADPDEPCRLPAGLQSDPYLKQVRATQAELGLRWSPTTGQKVNVALFRSDNQHDIVFGSVSATSQLGYFRNVPKTRHQGLDAEWQAQLGPVDLQLAYSRLDATYRFTDTLRMGERNVTITPGTRIAGLPRHTLKAGADWQAAPALSFGADLQWLSRRGVQGNEDQRIEDGEDEAVNLSLGGYAILNLRARWQPLPSLTLTAGIANVTNRHYASYGMLAETVFDAQGQYTGNERDAVFVAPGAPRSYQVGAKLVF